MWARWKDILVGLGCLMAVLAGYQIYHGRDGYIAAIMTAAICFFFGFLDRLSEFSFSLTGGLQAKTRELFNDAKNTLDHLKVIGKMLSMELLRIVHAEGRWGGGLSRSAKQDMKEGIANSLREIGLDESDVKEILEVEYPFTCFDYSSYVTNRISKELTQEQRLAWNEFFDHNKRKGIGYEALPDELEQFLSSQNLLNDEIKDRLEDYRYYRENKSHRRPDKWSGA